MLGDNRDNSSDSRFFGARGVSFVPEENLIRRAEITFFSVSPGGSLFEFWEWPFVIR
jgi:signal peptidase I